MGRTITLFLFRHGETTWNAEGRFQGHLDIPLNEIGKEQARALGRKFKSTGIALNAILASDLIRSVLTAQLAAAEMGLDPTLIFQDAGIREAHLGGAQGLTLDEIRGKFGDDTTDRWRSNKTTDADISYPGGESGTAVLDRTLKTLKSFIENHPGFSTIGISTHGGVIRRLMHWILVQEGESGEHIPIPNGVVYELRHDRETSNWKVAK